MKYELLDNKEWLQKQYVNNKLSTLKIANLVGARSGNSVRQALIRHNIPVRNRSDGQTVSSDDDFFIMNYPIFFGSLLGDGSLKVHNKHSDASYPHFHKKNITYDHVYYVASHLFAKNAKSRISLGGNYVREKWCSYYILRTLAHKDLLPVYNTWYPASNNYKKLIPEDVVISSELLLHMFLDDGSSSIRRKHSKTKHTAS